MGKVLVWAGSAYEALVKHYPDWHGKVHEKARRNHPLTDTQKWRDRLKSKVRILVEHVIRAIKIFRCCSDRTRNLKADNHTRFWIIGAGLWNQKQADTLGITAIFD